MALKINSEILISFWKLIIGTGPDFSAFIFKTSRKKADWPRLSGFSPTKSKQSPTLAFILITSFKFFIIPTPPIVGVGKIGQPLVSL